MMVATQKHTARMIIVCGFPGTGKTTFAIALADKIDAVHFNTDRIRDDLGARGEYSASAKANIYDHLFLRARQILLSGRDVVLDGTFYKQKIRKPFIRFAKEQGIPVWWIEIQATEEVVRERVSKSRPFTEADFAVYQKVKLEFDPLPPDRLLLDSMTLTVDEMVQRTLTHLNETQ